LPFPDTTSAAGSAFAPAPVDRDVCGRAHALTVLSGVAPWWSLFLRIQFAVRPRLPKRMREKMAKPLEDLSFIHFARWTLIRRLPADPASRPERLGADLLLFESNFNGDWEQYIDAFSYVIPSRMKLLWQGAYGFPGPLPSGPFKEFIRANEYEAAHYYSAYPEASVTMILDALALDPKLDELVGASERLDAKRFAERFEALLTEVQP
jgi:hypothetical protein